MKRRSLVTVVCAIALLTAVPAQAASPKAGWLSKTKKSLSWKGASFTFSSPWASNALCLPDDPGCDHFTLKLTLGDRAKVEVKIVGTNACSSDCVAQPVEGNDFDLFVYDANGHQVKSSATAAGKEAVTFVHRKTFNGKPYTVEVVAFAVTPGSTYKGTARAVTLGK